MQKTHLKRLRPRATPGPIVCKFCLDQEMQNRLIPHNTNIARIAKQSLKRHSGENLIHRCMFTGFTHVGSCLVPTRCSCSLILESRILNYHVPPSVCWRIGGFRRTGWVKYFANWSECRPTFHFHEEPAVQREIFHQHGLPNWPVSFTCTLS